MLTPADEKKEMSDVRHTHVYNFMIAAHIKTEMEGALEHINLFYQYRKQMNIIDNGT
jgi:hypothetical protein